MSAALIGGAVWATTARVDHRLPTGRILIVAHATMRIRTEIDWHKKVLASIDRLETH